MCRNRIDPAQGRTYLSLYRLFWSLWYPQWHQSPHRGRWSAKIIRIMVLKSRTAWVKLDLTEISTSRPQLQRLLQEKGAALQPRWVMGQHPIPSDPIRSHQIPPTSRTVGWSHRPAYSLFIPTQPLNFSRPFSFCFSWFVTFDVTSRIKSSCFYPRWVSISTRSCRKSGFLTWTLPMILANRSLGAGRERTGAAWCCCAALLDLGKRSLMRDAALSGAAGLTSLPLLSFF